MANNFIAVRRVLSFCAISLRTLPLYIVAGVACSAALAQQLTYPQIIDAVLTLHTSGPNKGVLTSPSFTIRRTESIYTGFAQVVFHKGDVRFAGGILAPNVLALAGIGRFSVLNAAGNAAPPTHFSYGAQQRAHTRQGLSNFRFTLSAYLATAGIVAANYAYPFIRVLNIQEQVFNPTFTNTTTLASPRVRVFGIDPDVGTAIWRPVAIPDGDTQWVDGTKVATVELDTMRNAMSAVAKAEEFTFQWQAYSGNSWADISGQTTPIYTFFASHFGGSFGGITSLRVRVTDRAGWRTPPQEVLRFVLPAPTVALGYDASGNITSGFTGTPPSSPTYQWYSSTTENGTYAIIGGQNGATWTPPTSYTQGQTFVQLSISGASFTDTLTSPIRVFGLQSDANRTPIISRTSSSTDFLFGWTNRESLLNVRSIKASDSEISVIWKSTCRAGNTCPVFSAARQSAQTLTIAKSDANQYESVSVGVVDVANTQTIYSAAQQVPAMPLVSIAVNGQVASVTIVANSLVVTNPTYQWQDSTTPSGTYANVASAGNKTYDFSSHSASRPYLRVSVSYTHSDTGVGATNVISPPILLASRVAKPGIIQNGKNVNLISNGFPVGAIDKNSILEYLISSTGIVDGICPGSGTANTANCRPDINQYASGSDATTGEFILTDSYFVRSASVAFLSVLSNDRGDLGFWAGRDSGGNTNPERRVVRMFVEYKIVPNGETYTLESNFVSLTLAADVVQVVGGSGNNSRALSISVISTQTTLFSSRNNAAFQWQSAPTANGTYTNIASANSSVYNAPSALTHNRFYRAIWQYNYTRGSSSPQVTRIAITLSHAVAAPAVPVLRVALPSNGFGNATAEFVSGANLVRSSPTPIYQWQNADAADGTFEDITGATGTTYNITEQYNVLRSYLRVQLTYTHGPDNAAAQIVYSPALVALRLPLVSISLSGAQASVSVVAHDSVIATSPAAVYQWQNSATENGTFADIANVTGKTYDVPQTYNAARPYLRMRLRYTHTNSVFGARDAFSSALRVAGVQSGTASFALSGAPVVGGEATVNVSEMVDIFGRAVLTQNLTYQWYSGDGTNWNIIDPNGTGASYTIAAANFDKDNRQLSLQVEDPAGLSGPFNPSPLAINQNPTGVPAVILVGGGAVVAGKTVRVDTSGITDPNNGGQSGTYTYQWQNNAGVDKSGQTGQDYILIAADIGVSNLPKVKVTLQDSLGFTFEWVAEVQQGVDVQVTRTDAQLAAALTDPSNRVQANTDSYTWLQSATENGTYAAIVPSATNKNYTVPAAYGTSHPFVRVSVTYTDAGAAANVVSNPIRVAGVASGTVGITNPLANANVGVGNVVTSDITNLTNVLNLAVRAEDLTYQWFSGDGTNWNIIGTNGRGASYTIVAAFFTNDLRQLSLRVTDPTGSSGPFDAPPINLQRETTGDVGIDASRLSVDATVTANTNNLSDLNGKGTYTYAWYYLRDGGTPQVISGAQGVSYVISKVDLPSGSAALNIIVSVTHIDALGFETALSSVTLALTDVDSSGAPAVASDSLYAGGALTADVSGISDFNGTGTYTYQWQQQNAGGSWANVSSGSGGNTNIYTFPASGWAAVPMLRVSVVHTDGLGYIINLVSPPFAINQETSGEPFVMLVGGGAPAVGKIARVVTSGITDANIGTGQSGTYSYQWQDNDNTNKSSGTGQDYTLTADDVTAINEGTPPKVLVTLQDSLGFMHDWTVQVHVVEARITRTGTRLDAALTDPGNVALDGSESYQWQQSATESGNNYTAISGETSAAYTVPANYGTALPFVISN